MPETSIVIRSFNEAEYIGDVLEAVSGQEYQNFEIILVDSGSTDGTLEIAESYVDKIEFVAPNDFTFGHSCNIGCEAAEGQFVSFLSAHAIPTDRQWLGPMIGDFQDDEVAMTYSNQVGAEENKFPEKRLFDELFQEDRKRQTPPDYFANNASSVIRKELWEEHKFNEYLTGHEDIEWAKHFMDLGYVVIYEPDACIYHIHDETWEQVYNRFEREAIADVEIGIKDRSDRWREYANIPMDMFDDTIAAIQQGEFDTQTFSEIIRFRYNQHIGTAAGLKSDRDLESDRFEYFYGGANERVIVDEQGNASLERAPLPEIKPNDVLIKAEYIGVTPEDNNFDELDSDVYPIVPGRNYVGTVIDLGANANSVAIGDVVIGATEYDCGVCEACSDGRNEECLDPIRLGRDTDNGAYSRFLAVPSDHVYSLNTDPKDGAVVGTLARSLDGIDRAESVLPDDAYCTVVGNTPKAELVAQIIQLDGYHVERIDQETPDHEHLSADKIRKYDLVVDTTGNHDTVQEFVSRTDSNAVVLLLASDYEGLTLSHDVLANKTVIHADTEKAAEMERVLDLLPKLKTDRILDGTYSLDEYESAWDAASEQHSLPVISVHSAVDAGSAARWKER